MQALLKGANVMRLVGILWDDNAPHDEASTYRIADSDCYASAPPYITEPCLEKIDWALKQASDAGVWAILAVRGKFAAGQDPSNDVFNNATLREMLFTAWEHVAARYAESPLRIAAYEILSEPRDKTVSAQQVHDFYAEGCSRVHAVDAATPCMVGPSRYYKLWELSDAVILKDTNVIYTFDYFVPEGFAFGESSVPTYPGTYECLAMYPGWASPQPGQAAPCCPDGARANVTFDGAWSDANFGRWALPVRAKHEVPLFVNQWSVVHGVSAAQGRYAFMRDLAASLQRLDIGWSWWVWRGGGGDTWAHGSSEFVYEQANGTVLLDDAAFAAVRGYMSDSDASGPGARRRRDGD